MACVMDRTLFLGGFPFTEELDSYFFYLTSVKLKVSRRYTSIPVLPLMAPTMSDITRLPFSPPII
jgi:hypothetical protein